MRCARCDKDATVTLDSDIGQQCARCWLEYVQPYKLGNIKNHDEEPRPKKGDRMGKSLVDGSAFVATGEVVRVQREPERSKAKADVGSFTGGIQYVPDEDGYW